jgi:hypothetical protein
MSKRSHLRAHRRMKDLKVRRHRPILRISDDMVSCLPFRGFKKVKLGEPHD